MPKFATPEDAQAWEDLLWRAFRAEDLSFWLPRLLAEPDIAFEISRTSEEGLDHPQILHNGDSITVVDPTVGRVRQVGPIGHFSATPFAITRSAPLLGANDGPFTPSPDTRAPVTPSVQGGDPTHPLSGVTIVEFGYFYAMPYGLAMAAALGARVIKLEDGDGDPHRSSFGPEVATNKTTAGKESLSVDLRTAEGRRIAQRLMASADAFVTSFRSGVAERLGLGYEELKALNPRLLYVHSAGYGTDGPSAARALYAQAAQAVGGSFGRQVAFWAAPENNVEMSLMELQAVVAPRLGQVVDGDSNAALAVLAAVTLGLYHQRRTGQGQFLMTSMIGGNAWAYSDDFCSYRGKQPVPRCDSEYLGTSALYRVYPAAADTWVCLAVRRDKEWDALVAALATSSPASPGSTDSTGSAASAASDILSNDERFATAAGRAAHDDALADVLGERFASAPAQDWEQLLSGAGVGCVAAFMGGHAAFMSYDPELRRSGLTVEIDHPTFGSLWRAAPPIAFSETPGRVGPPCRRGEHNHAILAELGYGLAGVQAFEKDLVVIAASP